MSALTQRLAAVRGTTAAQPKGTATVSPVMWSQAGQDFQRWAEPKISDKSQSALCGRLVTAINNNEITLADAQIKFMNDINNAQWGGASHE